MGQFDIQRMSAKADAVAVFQVIYKGSETHAAMLDVYVDTIDPAMIIKIGRPGCGLAGAQDTNGRAEVKVGILGDETGAMELPDGAALIQYVSSASVIRYVAPRLAGFLARIHGQALTT